MGTLSLTRGGHPNSGDSACPTWCHLCCCSARQIHHFFFCYNIVYYYSQLSEIALGIYVD